MRVAGKRVSKWWWFFMIGGGVFGAGLILLLIFGNKEITVTNDDVETLLAEHLPKTIEKAILGQAAKMTISGNTIVDFQEGNKIFVSTDGIIELEKGSASFGLEFIFFPELRSSAVYLPLEHLDVVNFQFSEEALANIGKAKDEAVTKVKVIVGEKVNKAMVGLAKIGLKFNKGEAVVTGQAAKKAVGVIMKKAGIEFDVEKFKDILKENVKGFAEGSVIIALNTFPVKKLNGLESIVVLGVDDIVSDDSSITIYFSFFQLGVKLVVLIVIFVGLMILVFKSPRFLDVMSVGVDAINIVT